MVVNSVVISDEVVGGGNVVIVVNEAPDSLTIPDSVETDPSLLVTSHVVVNSVVTSAATLDEVGGGNVVIVVKEVPDSLTIPDQWKQIHHC